MRIKRRSNALRVPPVKKPIRIKRKTSNIEEESTVSKAIENVKKVFEKRNVNVAEVVSIPKIRNSYKITKPRNSQVKLLRKRRVKRGIVYLGHVPHGFYEEEMEDYFKQFGKVIRVRVVRSRNTGRSRGYGYVEFMHPEVAKIAAETMNNYLMSGRLLKATYIPPEKQHIGFFAGRPWTEELFPKVNNRDKITKRRNANITEEKHKSFIQSAKNKLSALESKMKEQGFDMKFVPVDDLK